MSKNREKLLVIGHVWPQPNATAAGEHMMHLIECFASMKYELFFASAAAMPEGFAFGLDLEIKCFNILINDESFDDFLKDICPDVVLFDRFMVEEQFSWRVRSICPNAIRLLDTEDLHFLRKGREDISKGKHKEGVSDVIKRELASIYRSDLSLIISQVEHQLLIDQYNISPSILHYLPLLSDGKKSIQHAFNKRKDLFFIGNFLHEPNWQTVLHLKKEVWPILKKLLPEVQLHIYGSHAQQKHLQLTNPQERFYVKGYVENVETVFLNYRLLIAPIPFGAGQKGKLLKAIEYQLPFVTTEIGAEGMFLDAISDKVIANNTKEFIESVCQLYTNQEEWEQVQEDLSLIIDKHFDKEYHFKNFRQRLKELENEIASHRETNIVGQLLWHHSMRSTEYMSRWIIEKNKNL